MEEEKEMAEERLKEEKMIANQRKILDKELGRSLSPNKRNSIPEEVEMDSIKSPDRGNIASVGSYEN